tara:strand:+ start:1341 stop:1478 length:138 start_codon:yes stop_codon:yes gene_type:complete
METLSRQAPFAQRLERSCFQPTLPSIYGKVLQCSFPIAAIASLQL